MLQDVTALISCMGNISEDVSSSCSMILLVLLAAFSVISWSSMSSALAKSDVEGDLLLLCSV